MNYLGGKQRVAAHLKPVIDSIAPGAPIWDAMCGGLGFALRFRKERELVCSDINPWLIHMYQKIFAGEWHPPHAVSEGEYAHYKLTKPMDPMTAFCGHACSFGGKWFDGYARNGKRNYAAESARWLIGFFSDYRGLSFFCDDVIGRAAKCPVVYCDPPYRGTRNGYARVQTKFDHDAFWQWCQRMADDGAHVFASEQTAPDGWRTLWQRRRRVTSTRMRTTKQCNEKLFYAGPWNGKGIKDE